MSKLGIHVSAGNRQGFSDLLAKCNGAGSPVPVIFTVDQNIWPDVQQHSPGTIVVFRTQHDIRQESLGDGPGGMYQVDPVQTARDWMKAMMPVWKLNPAHYYAPLNEQDPPTLEAFEWLNDFTVECLNIAEANNFKLALYAFSGGNPKDVDHPAIGNPFTLEDAWHALLPSMQRAKAIGHILLLHEYGFDFVTLQASAPHLATRYRRSYRYLHQFNADPALVVSEASAGVGGFIDIGLKRWLDDARWYDGELMRDKVVIGCCLYQLGGDENIRGALPALGDYISQTPTPAPQGDPIVPFDVTPTGEHITPAGGGAVTPPGGDGGAQPGGGDGGAPSGGQTPPPSTTIEPLDFEVRLIDNRKDPDRPKGIILTFKIESTGGVGPYTYGCEGQALSGPTRERPSSRTGPIIETYTVTSSDGQTKQKKFFFAASDFPPPHD